MQQNTRDEMNPITCNNMNEPGGYYVKRNKLDTEKYCMTLLKCGI